VSTYQFMDHAKWMETQNRAINRRDRGRKNFRQQPEELTDFQKRVVDIIGMVGGGIYNAPIGLKVDWEYGGNGVSFIWHRELATFDFDQLTRLVFLCHEARIRCEVTSGGPRMMRLAFWQRKPEGDIAVRHPNLDEAVSAFREYLPEGHRIVYQGENQPSAVPGASIMRKGAPAKGTG
jgi:hypothetical protein